MLTYWQYRGAGVVRGGVHQLCRQVKGRRATGPVRRTARLVSFARLSEPIQFSTVLTWEDALERTLDFLNIGGGDGTRTHDFDLAKVAL